MFCWEHFHRICYSASSGQLGFRLTVYPSPQFLQINGRLYHASLPHLAVEEIKLSMAPLLQRHYSPSALLRATPPSCCLQPLSRVSSYRADLLRRFLSWAYRTSPVSVVSMLPCRRQYPAGV